MNINTLVPRVQNAIRNLADANPTYIYEKVPRDDASGVIVCFCNYKPDVLNPLGCIVGAALDAIGVPYDPDWEDNPARSVLKWLIDGVRMTDDLLDAIAWINTVQDYQDRGHAWPDAVELADLDQALIQGVPV